MLDPIMVDAAGMYPNRCACGTSTGPLIDTHSEYEGCHIYVCVRCAKAYGRMVGMVARDDVDLLEQRMLGLEADKLLLETELADARPVLDAMARAASRFGGDD